MNKLSILLTLLPLLKTLNIKASTLKVQTVRTTDQFSISPIPREPSFKIVLHRSRVIQSPTHDINHSIRKVQSLIKLLRSRDHMFHLIPTLLRLANHKLLNFLKLVDSENPPSVLPMSTRFLSETSGKSSEFHRQLLGSEGLVVEVCRDRLFGSCDEIVLSFIVFVLSFSGGHFVKLVIEIGKLRSFSHDTFLHEERSLHRLVLLFHEEIETVVDKGHVQKSSVSFQKVPSVTSDFTPSFRVVPIDHRENLMMMRESWSGWFCDGDTVDLSGAFPGTLDSVVVFVVVDDAFFGDEISDLAKVVFEFFLEVFGLFGEFFFLLFHFLDLFDEVVARLFFFLFLADLFGERVEFFVETVVLKVGISPLFVQVHDGVHSVDFCLWLISFSLDFFDLFRVVASFFSE